MFKHLEDALNSKKVPCEMCGKPTPIATMLEKSRDDKRLVCMPCGLGFKPDRKLIGGDDA